MNDPDMTVLEPLRTVKRRGKDISIVIVQTGDGREVEISMDVSGLIWQLASRAAENPTGKTRAVYGLVQARVLNGNGKGGGGEGA